jgi:DNA-directed RNA polymerase subunit K/omega
MIDNPGAQKTIGNIFEYVLVASERVRELNRQRADSGQNGLPPSEYSKLEKLHTVAARDIEEGRVTREYLKRIGERHQETKRKQFMR